MVGEEGCDGDVVGGDGFDGEVGDVGGDDGGAGCEEIGGGELCIDESISIFVDFEDCLIVVLG